MPIGTPITIGSVVLDGGIDATTTMATTADSPSGNLIVVAIYIPSATATLLSVTDSVGNTYVLGPSRRHNTDTSRFLMLAYCPNAIALPSASEILFTTTETVSGIRGVCALTVSGVSVIDKTNTNVGSSTTWSTGSSGTLTVADEVAIAVGWALSGTANTPDSGWTETSDVLPQSGRRLVMQYKVVASTTALNGGGTWGNAVWIGIIATFRASSQRNKIKLSGSFQTKTVRVKIGGSFVSKPLKTKIGGIFV